jgi:hypothetical protein
LLTFPLLGTVLETSSKYGLRDGDQTGLFWRFVPDGGLSTGEVPGQKKKKDRVTVMMTAKDGSDKKKALVCWKSKATTSFSSSRH